MSTKRQQDEADRLKAVRVLEKDPHPDKTGVLLSDEIEFYVRQSQLICPFAEDNLKPAAYELTVGDEAVVGGKPCRLSDCWPNHSLSIPAFEVAVIKTAETLNLPRFLIGRWNIRVAWAYKGLVWVGGPQVDPGYVGHLFCPIYNLSNKEVSIKRGQPIAVLDFVKTTEFDPNKGEEKWERYPRPPKRLVIEDFGIDDFRSGPVETKDKLERIEKKVDSFIPFVFPILAILMAAIGLPYLAGSKTIQPDIRTLDAFTLFCSLLALILSVFNWKWRPSVFTFFNWRWRKIAKKLVFSVIIVLAIAIALCLI